MQPQEGYQGGSFWEDLKAARMKVALALSTGKAIEIKGGNYIRAEDADISEDAARIKRSENGKKLKNSEILHRR